MRILLINYEYPPLGGGAGNATHHLARQMTNSGHQVTVMTSRFGDLPHREQIEGFTVIRIPALRKAADRSNPLEMVSFMLSSMAFMLKLRRQFDYSIAFFGIPGAPAAWVLKMIDRVPYLVSLRGGDVPGFQPYDLKHFHRLTRPLIRYLWKHAAEVVANSRGLALLAQQTAPHRDIKVIPNGVDTDFFTPAPVLPLNRWMFAGRLREQKGLHFLIEAVALLTPDERRDLKITVVGDGPWREKFLALAEQLRVCSHFEFVGWVSRPDLLAYYQAHGGFILPSLDEGMPNVLLEAMACGLPVIATRIAGNEELVNGNGWLVQAASAQEISDALRAALADLEQLRDMGRTSRTLAAGYSWQQVTQRYLELMSSR